MKMKIAKTAAKLLVRCGYADYYKSTSTANGEVIAYWVCWYEEGASEPEWDDAQELVEQDNINQKHALED